MLLCASLRALTPHGPCLRLCSAARAEQQRRDQFCTALGPVPRRAKRRHLQQVHYNSPPDHERHQEALPVAASGSRFFWKVRCKPPRAARDEERAGGACGRGVRRVLAWNFLHHVNITFDVPCGIYIMCVPRQTQQIAHAASCTTHNVRGATPQRPQRQHRCVTAQGSNPPRSIRP